MDRFTAMMIAEGAYEAESTEQWIEAWQYLIDSHTIGHLQGSYGRTAAALIAAGECTPAERVSA